MARPHKVNNATLSKFLCFLSRLAARPLALSTSIMRSSTSLWSLCLVFSREAHLEFTASICSSASWRRWASFFLLKKCRIFLHALTKKIIFTKWWSWKSLEHYTSDLAIGLFECYSLGFLKLLSALNGISFILRSPLSHLTVGLGHSTLQLSLGLLLLLKLLPQQITVVASWLQSMGKSILGLL